MFVYMLFVAQAMSLHICQLNLVQTKLIHAIGIYKTPIKR